MLLSVTDGFRRNYVVNVMNLLWIVFIMVTAGTGVYLYVTTLQAEKLKRPPSGGERIDLRSDGTVVDSDPAASTPGDIGYVAPPKRHYRPPGEGQG